jgi:DNA-binding transcriptional LysR family regulator
MERRHLEYFLAVANHGSFTSAASALRIAQPSLSYAIRSLEREFGAALFHRLGRGIALTSAGEALLGPARQALREFEMAWTRVQQVASLEAGRLDVVALTSLAVDPLARLVGEFRIAHPGIQVRIVDPERAVAVPELVRRGECEVGFVDSSAPLGGLNALDLPDQEMYAVLPPQHGERVDEPLTLKQVAALGLVITPPGSATRTLVEIALAEAGETRWARASAVTETGRPSKPSL